MKIYAIMILSFIVCNCSKKNVEQKSNNEYLECVFIQKNVRYPAKIGCGTLSSSFYDKKKHLKFINNKDTLNTFKELFSHLLISNEQNDQDSRIQIIYSHDKKKDTICMGEYSGISVDGVNMKDNKEFFNFVKEMLDYENTVRHPITGKMIPKEEL